MTTDPAAAIEFYGKVVGYGTESWGGEGGEGYKMWKTPAGPTIGGVMELPEQAKAMGAPSHWVGNLCVASVDEAVEKLKAHGGVVHQGPFDVPSIGRIAMVADASGAGFALYQPEGKAPGHQGEPAHGEIAWAELCSGDVDKAWALYSDIAGWKKGDAMDMGPMGTYQLFGPGEQSTGGMMAKPPEMPVSAWLYYIQVDDLDGSVAIAKENGATLIHGPAEVPGGSRIVNMLDPQGAFLALIGK